MGNDATFPLPLTRCSLPLLPPRSPPPLLRRSPPPPLPPPPLHSTRKDIIHIQDPLNMQQRAIEAFDHVKNDLRVEEEEEEGKSKCVCVLGGGGGAEG